MSGSPSPSKSSARGSGYSSQPDLSKLDEAELRISSFRKRKTTDDGKYQFEDLKKEILEILTASSKSNSETFSTVSQNISLIRDQLSDIKATTEHLITENNNLKSQIGILADTVKESEQKIEVLQSDVQQLRSAQSLASSTSLAISGSQFSHDDVLAELQERTERSKNVVIVGLPEPEADTSEERQHKDETEVKKVLKTVASECPIKRVQRLGKYDARKNRPLKVFFDSNETVKTILRNKKNADLKGVRIFPDQTLHQQKTIKELRNELKLRQENGESDITIKYVKGTPKITKEQSKN